MIYNLIVTWTAFAILAMFIILFRDIKNDKELMLLLFSVRGL